MNVSNPDQGAFAATGRTEAQLGYFGSVIYCCCNEMYEMQKQLGDSGE
jgi:hypothetical protein